MNIDERLEAITRNLDALAQLQADTSREWREAHASTRRDLDTLTKIHLDSDREWREAQAANEKRFTQITYNFEIVLDSIKRLEAIATAHDQRLDDIEGQ